MRFSARAAVLAAGAFMAVSFAGAGVASAQPLSGPYGPSQLQCLGQGNDNGYQGSYGYQGDNGYQSNDGGYQGYGYGHNHSHGYGQLPWNRDCGGNGYGSYCQPGFPGYFPVVSFTQFPYGGGGSYCQDGYHHRSYCVTTYKWVQEVTYNSRHCKVTRWVRVPVRDCGTGSGGDCGCTGGDTGGKCVPQEVIFDMAAYSSTIDEVSGPALFSGEQVTYQGQGYVVTDAHNGTFKVEQNGQVVTNGRHAITDGKAFTVCLNQDNPAVTIS